jgi:hypothetical protein
MCDKKISSIVHAQHAPVEQAAGLLTAAERELAAFYETVCRRYGLKEARKAAQDWIEELETMDWPADWAFLNWHQVTIVAADCLAFRIIDQVPGALLTDTSTGAEFASQVAPTSKKTR